MKPLVSIAVGNADVDHSEPVDEDDEDTARLRQSAPDHPGSHTHV